MRSIPLRHLVATTIFLCTSMSASAQHAVHKRTFTPPPPADLSYTIKARQNGFSLNGEALIKWRTTPGTFSISTETRSPLVGKIVDATSSGSIDAFGLAPATFVENRWRKEPTTTTFDRTAKIIRFAPEADTFPLLGGEQDRNSVIWQLIAVARANAAAFKVNSSWDFFVAGPRDAEPWVFTVVKEEKLDTTLGPQRTVHVTRAPPPDSKGQQLDIWLAPGKEWYPVKVRFSEADGDFIEQSLEKIGSVPG
ncbi:DUF3108 domain-containing protein [Actimicrobium sp. CCI2.3]|uniref:DUF3108 domain-containing protein n=1 Tax=Actimicrobium sp. CCI2.3 TaxID=3048616 RepID=UPI002AB40D5A|nr:DUF3108 domain-containing protein [Actimicrobium sp. CCI2.3]MDY7576328.1 DUF3108 domain-containing protein [Actimicrobium sp. CCI2.3]MEB0020468.1 DUF3108 domain-containing protein [Actimicrobium sp. CCI2.3]